MLKKNQWLRREIRKENLNCDKLFVLRFFLYVPFLNLIDQWQTILIFLRNILKFSLNLIGLDRYWLIIRDKLKGEKVLIPEELSDFPNYESPLSPINPESEDRIHRIIYCVSKLKDSK